ncbi:MAG: transglutaminase-like domain-containing protein [Sedimentisphaerales bacterium]|jgi:hypothetical protein
MKARLSVVVLIALQCGICIGAQTQNVEYYAVLMDGTKVGYATHSRAVANGQVTTTETVDMKIDRAGVSLSISTTETCVETLKGEPISFSTEQNMGIGTMKIEGTVGKDGIVRTRTTGMGAVQDSNMTWSKGAVMAEGLRLIEAERGLKEGAEYDVKIFSPGAMAAIDSHVRVGAKQAVDLLGRVVTLTKVETTMSMPGTGEMTTTCFVDDEFGALKSIMSMAGMNVEMVACAKEFALGDNQALDIVDKMFVASPAPIENVGSAKSITYYLKPVEGAGGFTIPSGDNQQVQRQGDGSVIVVVKPVSAPAGVALPYNGTDKKIFEETRPSRYLQSDDAKIIAIAKRAAGDAKDAAEAARKIERFVAGYVTEASLSVGYASASEVAVSRRGDCTEFAVLCAATCRAAGIPARVVMGVAYVEDFEGRTGFGGHAWTEAYIGGKWVGLDSAFNAGGLGGFDAGHIAFAAGDGEPADFFNIATTLGRFKIEKIIVNRGE